MTDEAGAHAAAVADLRRDGFTVLQDWVPASRVAELLQQIERHYPAYLGRAPMPDDIVQVGDRRFHSPLPFGAPLDVADVLLQDRLGAIADAMLGPGWVIEALGVVYAYAGAKAQHLHRDGAVLFGETGLDRVAPPSALTFSLPLIGLDSVCGRTAFHPGTHRFTEPSGDPVAPDVAAGAATMWDFRILHFAEANRSEAARPMLYATFCRPFWIDHRNFVAGRNAKLQARANALEKLGPEQRARFVRAELI